MYIIVEILAAIFGCLLAEVLLVIVSDLECFLVFKSRSVELTAQLMGFSTESVRKTILTALEKLKHSNYSERLQEGVSWIYSPRVLLCLYVT